jgi:two-component system, LytTR family, response regulator
MRVVIIDNDRPFLEKLVEMLNEIDDIEIVGTAENFNDGIAIINQQKPELIFLDVELNDKTGFDVLKEIEEIDFQTIFITAYEDYALRAIKFSALDYLLKPFSFEDLKASIQKAKNNIDSDFSLKASKILIQNNYTKELQKKRLGLTNQDGVHFVILEDIITCKADGNYTEFFLLNNQKILTSCPIKKYEELLSDSGFFRVHKSHIINLYHVKSFLKNGEGSVVMTDGKTIEISRRKKDILLEKLKAI